MKENKAYKFRIYPNTLQQEMFSKTFGAARFVYNKMLEDKIAYYEETGKMLKATPAQYKKEYEFLKEVDSLALSNAQLQLETAYKNFFRDKRIGFPKFKSKKHPKQSYTTNLVNGNIRIDGKEDKTSKGRRSKDKAAQTNTKGTYNQECYCKQGTERKILCINTYGI